MNRYLVLAGFFLVTVGGGLAIGFVTRPGAWYAGLVKPSFNPPNWIFGPAWTVLYVLIAVAGWRVFEREPGSAAMAVWAVALALNFLWSPVFFGAQRPEAARAVVAMLLAATVVFIALAWRIDATAALLFVPYAAWVAFATLLNAAVVRLN
jgi:tryptophan-rich sensory protein